MSVYPLSKSIAVAMSVLRAGSGREARVEIVEYCSNFVVQVYMHIPHTGVMVALAR